MSGEVSLHIDAPPEKVWDLVSDVTRIGEFSPETFEARWRRGSTGPEVGARFKGHVKRNGIGPTYWSACRVTECVPDEVFEFVVEVDGPMDGPINRWGYRLAARRRRAPGSPSTTSSVPPCPSRRTGSCSARCAAAPTRRGCGPRWSG